MRELSLVRSTVDRKRYELPGVGLIQVKGWLAGDDVSIVADGVAWECRKAGFFSGALQATDKAGTIDGWFKPTFFGGGGEMHWGGIHYAIRSSGFWRTRYRLELDGVALWEFCPRSSGAHPMTLIHHEGYAPNAAVLFGAAVARTLHRRKQRSGNGGGGGGGGGA